ncbi:MAG: VWA domain-containing protein [Eubacteriales bacterium]|nr:VWA domain-containing protein [Eubacteriales bacterium]
MKDKLKRLIALVISCIMCVGLLQTTVLATEITEWKDGAIPSGYIMDEEDENNKDIVFFDGTESEAVTKTEDIESLEMDIDEFTSGDELDNSTSFFSGTVEVPTVVPADAVLSFSESYSGAVGEQVAITATFVCTEAPDSFVWECNEENAITFSQTSVMGPVETGVENTYWVSTMLTGVKEGNYTVTLTVGGSIAKTVSASTNYTVTKALTTRYIALVLDASGSMSGNPAKEQKKAAKKFCASVLNSTGINYIAIVKLGYSASVGCGFTNDLSILTNYIDSFPANDSTNTNHALEIAGNLLDNISDTSNNLSKNIVICSDGLPQSGSSTVNGPYTSQDISYYFSYANSCYNTAVALKEKGYLIYSLGFFHSLYGTELTFAKRFMSDLASEKCYYEVVNADDLEFTFGEIAEDITVEPISIDISDIKKISETDKEITYSIHVQITNNSKSVALTNVFVNIDEGDNASIVESEWKQSVATLGVNESQEFIWNIKIDRTKYYDGGSHIFTVYAGSDQTVTASKQESIALEAVNERSNELKFETDVWNFHNFSENKIDETHREPHPITDNDKNAFLSGLSASDRAAVSEMFSNGSNGHCFGMALTSILNKMNIFHISDYSDVSSLREANLNDRIWSILCYYQNLQNFKSYSSIETDFIENYSTEEQISILHSKADAVKEGGCPVLFTFGCNGWGGTCSSGICI